MRNLFCEKNIGSPAFAEMRRKGQLMESNVSQGSVDFQPVIAPLCASLSFAGGGEPLKNGAQAGAESSTNVRPTPHALVVDDVEDVIELLALFLKHAGYEVTMANCGPDALEVARREQFDVIVSDIGMPGMDGYELAQKLRALPAYSRVPMIAVTGFSKYDDSGRALASGFNAHLTKPINQDTLLEVIERLRD